MANRRRQIEEIQCKALILYKEISELLDDLRKAYDNMPASLRESSQALVASDRIDTLEDWLDVLEDVSGEIVE